MAMRVECPSTAHGAAYEACRAKIATEDGTVTPIPEEEAHLRALDYLN